MKFNLGTKIILLLVILITLPLLVVGYRSTDLTKDNMTEQYVNSMQEVNKAATSSLENVLKDYEKSLLFLSNNINSKSIVSNPEYEPFLMDLLNGYREANPDVMNSYMGTASKMMYITPAQELPEGYDPTGRGWYTQAVSEGKAIWTAPYQDAATGTMVISAGIPVYAPGSTSQIVGVMAIDMTLDYFNTLVSQIDVAESGEAFIVNSEGLIFAHQNPELLGTQLDESQLAAFTATESGSMDYTDENGEERFITFQKFSSQDWIFVNSIAYSEITGVTDNIVMNVIIIGLVALLLAILIGIFASRTITNSVKDIEQKMKLVADGDFTVVMDVKTNDEIGSLANNFNIMIAQVKDLMASTVAVSQEVLNSSENLAAFAEQTSAASTDVANTVEEIARGASDQAHETETGVQIANSLSEKFEGLSISSEEMNINAKSTLAVNEEGINTLEELRHTSDISKQSNERVENAIIDLDKSATSINAILETITSIASQTNLLALNASIEAARAGEAGRGFAVVADEIRKLAEGSDNAAKEIKTILDKIQYESKNTVSIMKEVKGIYDQQVLSVEKVNTAFSEISNSVGSVADKIQKMNEQVETLKTEKERIVSTMENISAVSEETAAASEEVTASMQQQSDAVEQVAGSAASLSSLAAELMSKLASFKIN